MSCLFPGCSNAKHICKEVRYFEFPAQLYTRSKWLAACNVAEQDLPKVPLACSANFCKEEMALDKKRVRLSRNVVPKLAGSHHSGGNDVQCTKDTDACLEYLEGYEIAGPAGISRKVELLQQTEMMLRESIRMLLYEPVDTPEGQLARSMLKELKDLQNDMQMLQHSK